MYILWSDKKLTTSFFCGTWCFVLTWQNNWSSKGMQDTFSILKDFYKNQKWYFVSKRCPVLLPLRRLKVAILKLLLPLPLLQTAIIEIRAILKAKTDAAAASSNLLINRLEEAAAGFRKRQHVQLLIRYIRENFKITFFSWLSGMFSNLFNGLMNFWNSVLVTILSKTLTDFSTQQVLSTSRISVQILWYYGEQKWPSENF